MTYGYDANGNVTSQDKDLEDRLYGYDALDRLISDLKSDASDVIPDYGYQYDANGNRINHSKQSKNTDYNYTPYSNQLISVGLKAVTYDAAGNTISDRNGKRRYEYNFAGRLDTFIKNGTPKSRYNYNANGQRIQKLTYKETTTKSTVFHYDISGNLIGESVDGKKSRDYIWIDNQPIAQIEYKPKSSKVKNTTYLTTDHLNTSRIGTDSTSAIVWRWDSDGFGINKPDKDPDGDGKKINVRLRFPGQYKDGESGLVYNWNRYYDPKTEEYRSRSAY